MQPTSNKAYFYTMLVYPNAKINLGLFITDKRSDGYHNLSSLFLPIPWQDELQIEQADTFSFSSSGLVISGNPQHNLVVKAYELIKAAYGIPPVKIQLHKVIPMGAGLGGGSADAAFTLKALDQLFELKLSEQKLMEHAADLGSDCPFFIKNKAALVSGRGEMLDYGFDFKLKAQLLLVKPELFISTAEAYAGIKPKPLSRPLQTILKASTAEWRKELHNDFEASLFPLYPELANIKQKLYEAGAFYAAMSGSGSCMFGLFEEQPEQPEEFEGMQTIILQLKI